MNQIEALKKLSARNKALGDAQKNLKVKAVETKENRILTNIERENAFLPLIKPIDRLLNGLTEVVVIDGKEKRVPQLHNLIQDSSRSLLGSTRQPQLITDGEDDKKKDKQKGIAMSPQEVMDIIQMRIGTPGKLDYTPPRAGDDNGKFLGFDMNHDDFMNGKLTLTKDGKPLEIADPTNPSKMLKLNKVHFLKGAFALFSTRESIEKYGLFDKVDSNDIALFGYLVDELKNKHGARIPTTGRKVDLLKGYITFKDHITSDKLTGLSGDTGESHTMLKKLVDPQKTTDEEFKTFVDGMDKMVDEKNELFKFLNRNGFKQDRDTRDRVRQMNLTDYNLFLEDLKQEIIDSRDYEKQLVQSEKSATAQLEAQQVQQDRVKNNNNDLIAQLKTVREQKTRTEKKLEAIDKLDLVVNGKVAFEDEERLQQALVGWVELEKELLTMIDKGKTKKTSKKKV